MSELVIEEWRPGRHPEDDLGMLAKILHASVHAGASVSFVLPFSMEDARAFWCEEVLPGILAGHRCVVIARYEGEIVGTVQLLLDTPPNQQHRGEIAKLLVHPNMRRKGIARALMIAVEDLARAQGRTLLTLDTRTADHAEPLYLSMGYTLAGVIPNYARGPLQPDLEPTSILYKELINSSDR